MRRKLLLTTSTSRNDVSTSMTTRSEAFDSVLIELLIKSCLVVVVGVDVIAPMLLLMLFSVVAVCVIDVMILMLLLSLLLLLLLLLLLQ